MNPENNNYGSNMEPQSFGVPTPEQPIDQGFQPANNVVAPEQPGFAPFNNLNNETLNVPQDPFNPTPVDPSTFNAGVTNEIPAEPVNVGEVSSFEQPAPVVEQADTLNVAPTVDVPNEFNYQVPVENVEPVVEAQPIEASYTESPLDQTITFNQPISVEGNDIAQVVSDAPAAPEMPVQESIPEAPVQTGPTLPIPDQMPTTDYQATVSTPVDYVTPTSDFDQIGTTPELDPKQKTKKGNSKKTLLFCLIIILVASLGGGAYYLINIKGIFNSKGVTTKDLEVESGTKLSASIEDYGTFKNTSSSNCVLDLSKVDVNKAGKYKYTISCGTDTYEGNITVIDKTAPILSFNIVETKQDVPVTEKEFILNTLDAGETYAFTNPDEVREYIKTPGFYTVPIMAEDEAKNKMQYFAPLAVLSSDIRFNIRGTLANPDDNTYERLIIFCNNETICQAAFKAQIIRFNDEAAYKEMFKSYNGTNSFTYGSYTGIPLFYPSESKLVIITEPGISFGATTANTIFEEYKSKGYDMKFSATGSVDRNIINFDIDE